MKKVLVEALERISKERKLCVFYALSDLLPRRIGACMHILSSNNKKFTKHAVKSSMFLFSFNLRQPCPKFNTFL
ncbi:hypothetical protein Fmac_022729 [Flemingia macrophylla]|uniref:Uncharacterized protein n=1 Tax=Flemingia macrophylla TaxID=520843 RepID=A0ABD1M0I6_9FABA